MKTIGVIGGMSWESTALYYKWLNEGVKTRLGGHHSAEIMLASVDFAVIEELQASGDWSQAGDILAQKAKALESAGADMVLLATNTMHKVASDIESAIKIPFIHIAEATADVLKTAGIKKAGLLATIYTMEQDFYKGRLADHGIDILTPDLKERVEINRIIYEELCHGKILESSRAAFRCAALSLIKQGAQGVILGCTEIGMLIGQNDLPAPVFDTTKIHIEKALGLAL